MMRFPPIPPQSVSFANLQAQLATHPLVEEFLGPYYKRLDQHGLLTEDLTPSDWDATEGDLNRLACGVEDLRAHWHQNPIGRPKADLYAALAEIEGFWALLQKGFDCIIALPYKTVKGGGAPDALALRAAVPHLYEIKSLWAYREYMRYDFRTLPTGAYGFGKRPPGRSVSDARRLAAISGRRGLEDNDYNTLILDLCIHRLLRKAAVQLHGFAKAKGLCHCSKTIQLVVTSPGAILGVVRVGRDLAREWLAHHRHVVDDIEWLGGGQSESLAFSLHS